MKTIDISYFDTKSNYKLFIPKIVKNSVLYTESNMKYICSYNNSSLNEICEEIENYFDSNIYVLKNNEKTFILNLDLKKFYDKLKIYEISDIRYPRRETYYG